MKELSYLDFSKKAHDQSLRENLFIKAQIELTYACNLHCVHCYTDPYNKRELIQRELPYEEILKILDRLHEENILWLCFTGGEIFMRKDFMKIYDYAHEKGFLITLFTNATMVSESIADHLSVKRPFCIEVSIYGATQETYEKVTQVPGSFKRFEEGVERLYSRNLPLKMKTSLLTFNYHEADIMKAYAKKYKAPFKASHLIYPRLNGDIQSVRYRLGAAEVLELTFAGIETEQEDSCAEKSSSTGSETGISDPRLYRCGCGKLNVHIDPYGQTGTCTWARQGRFDARNKKIHHGMQLLAQQIASQYYTQASPCFSCKAAEYCSKSPEMAVHETGNSQYPVPYFCEVAFGTLSRFKKLSAPKFKPGDFHGADEKTDL